jgi:dipeptidyl aminopeptidase/acylaminoacyl peptidase
LEKDKKYPLIVLIHGGIHGNFSSSSANIVRELLEQEYIIISPDYRGSSGYGEIYWNLVDYGSTTIEDIYNTRNWMIEHCKQVDSDKIGVMGWSMGGYNTLMQIFNYPEAYSVAFAGVPVSDLLIRLSYRPWDAESRAEVYSGGKITDQYELRKRSPAWNAAKLQTPLLIHAASNDRDVYITEIENLIAHLKAAGKKFEYKIYEDPPGGHSFETLDTNFARNARKEAYDFLAKHLQS